MKMCFKMFAAEVFCIIENLKTEDKNLGALKSIFATVLRRMCVAWARSCFD